LRRSEGKDLKFTENPNKVEGSVDITLPDGTKKKGTVTLGIGGVAFSSGVTYKDGNLETTETNAGTFSVARSPTGESGTIDFDITVIPEPSTVLLLGLG
jgi:hypothetical protein